MKSCEAPVLLLMHGSGSRVETSQRAPATDDGLPLSVYETRAAGVDTTAAAASQNAASALLQRIKYLVVSEDAERITVEHMVQHQNASNQSESSASMHFVFVCVSEFGLIAFMDSDQQQRGEFETGRADVARARAATPGLCGCGGGGYLRSL